MMTALLVAYGCKYETYVYPNSATNTSEASVSITLKIGEIQTISSGITISMDSVITDSRCPKDMVCDYAGIAVVGFKISSSNGKTNFTLNTIEGFSVGVLVDGYRIKLINLNPERPSGGVWINGSIYEAEILVVKE